MPGIPKGDVQILVHTTAPSRGRDDIRYRALAQAYLDFAPVSQELTDYEASELAVEDVVEQVSSQYQDEKLSPSQGERQSRSSYRPEDDEENGTSGSGECSDYIGLDRYGLSQAFESPEISFNSATNNADSPDNLRKMAHENELSDAVQQRHHEPDSAESWKPPQSTKTSQTQSGVHLRDEQQGRRSPANETSRFDSTVSTPLGLSTFVLSEHPSTPLTRPPRRSARILSTLSTQAVGLKTQNLGAKRRRKPPGPERGQTSLSAFAREPSALASLREPTKTMNKRPRNQSPSSATRATAQYLMSSQSDIPDSSTASNSLAVSKWSHLIEIRPSPPKTSASTLIPELLVTHDLHILARKISMSKLYHPASQIRHLRPMERGYWLIPCENWNEGLRTRCWDCLGNYVGNDMAGWGVWCVRTEDFSLMRIYCWGIIVGHIYLLLYMASESKIKLVSACWVSGDGSAIIKMKNPS